MKTITRYGHSVHKEGSLPLGTYASHIILTKGTTLVNMIIIKCEKWQICIEISAGTLLWIYQRLIGRSNITLARQDQYIGNISNSLRRLSNYVRVFKVS